MLFYTAFLLVIAVNVGIDRLSKARWLGVGKVCDTCNNSSAVVLLIIITVLYFIWFEVVCTVNESHFLPHRQV